MWHGRQKWEADEVAILQRLFVDPLKSREVILRALSGRTWKAIQCRAQKEGLIRPNPLHHHINRDYFANVDTFDKAYDLGVLAADGTVLDSGAISLYLQKRDRVLVANIRDRLAPDAPIYQYKNSYGFKIGCREMAADLEAYGITPRKSLTLCWPERLPDLLARPFLLGYFDGDGSLSLGARLGAAQWSMLGTRAFLEQARIHLERLSGMIIGEPRSAGGRTPELFLLRVYGQKAYALDRYLNPEGMGLARKHLPPESGHSPPHPSTGRPTTI